MKGINNMTRQEILNVPYRDKWNEEMECDSIIVIPMKVKQWNLLKNKIQRAVARTFHFIRFPEDYEVDGLHDSGYRCIDFVAVKKNKPIYRLAGGSDVLHFDGIGGYGYKWLEKHGSIPKTILPSNWDMDCLRKSGLLRIFCRGKIICGDALSSFEIYCKRED